MESLTAGERGILATAAALESLLWVAFDIAHEGSVAVIHRPSCDGADVCPCRPVLLLVQRRTH